MRLLALVRFGSVRFAECRTTALSRFFVQLRQPLQRADGNGSRHGYRNGGSNSSDECQRIWRRYPGNGAKMIGSFNDDVFVDFPFVLLYNRTSARPSVNTSVLYTLGFRLIPKAPFVFARATFMDRGSKRTTRFWTYGESGDGKASRAGDTSNKKSRIFWISRYTPLHHPLLLLHVFIHIALDEALTRFTNTLTYLELEQRKMIPTRDLYFFT